MKAKENMETTDKQKLKEMYDKLTEYYQKNKYLDFLGLYYKYEKASGVDNINAKMFLFAGKVMARFNRFEEAEKYYNLAILRYAVNASAFFELGALYEKRNELYKAEENYELALKYSQDNFKIKALMAIGNLYIKMFRYEDALGYFEYVLVQDEQNVKALNKIGHIYFYQKNYKKAKEYFSRALRLDSTNVNTLVALGKISNFEKDYNAACNYFENAILINEFTKSSLLDDAYLNLAHTYIFLGRNNALYYTDAKKILRQLIKETKIFKIKTLAYVYLGDIKMCEGKYEEADGLYLNAIKSDCHIAVSYFKLSDLYMLMGREIDARRMNEKAIELSMNRVKYFFNDYHGATLM